MQKYIIANWKMNGNLAFCEQLATDYNNLITDNAEIIIAAPYPYLLPIKAKLKNSKVKLAAQDCATHQQGAYTGEVSANMLEDIDTEYVIIGHSERRQYYHEHDDIIQQKVLCAHESKLKSILCIGESISERKNNQHLQIITQQLKWLSGHQELYKNLIIAYEPVWAIGSGMVPDNQQIIEVIAHIKNLTKQQVPVLYGGSVNAKNIVTLMQITICDGFLIGGSSLKIDEMTSIIHEL